MLRLPEQGVRELTASELRSVEGGCELVCAMARGLGRAYEAGRAALRGAWEDMLDDGPSLYYRAKAS